MGVIRSRTIFNRFFILLSRCALLAATVQLNCTYVRICRLHYRRLASSHGSLNFENAVIVVTAYTTELYTTHYCNQSCVLNEHTLCYRFSVLVNISFRAKNFEFCHQIRIRRMVVLFNMSYFYFNPQFNSVATKRGFFCLYVGFRLINPFFAKH